MRSFKLPDWFVPMNHILVKPSDEYRRSRTVGSGLLSKCKQRQLLTPEFDRIRSESRLAWLADWEDPGKSCTNKKSVAQFPTTYSSLHNLKVLDRPTRSRPTSPTRRNNPHPTKVFLHLRVLKDKGYPSSNQKPGQNPYSDKYGYETSSAPVPKGTMYYTLKDIRRLERTGQTEMFKESMNFHPEEPNETWLNTPMRGERAFHDLSLNRSENSVMCETIENSFKPEVVPSLHRWLKQAGKEEKEATTKLLKSLALDSLKNPRFRSVDPNRYVLRKYESTPRVTIHRPYRTDFVFHPELMTT